MYSDIVSKCECHWQIKIQILSKLCSNFVAKGRDEPKNASYFKVFHPTWLLLWPQVHHMYSFPASKNIFIGFLSAIRPLIGSTENSPGKYSRSVIGLLYGLNSVIGAGVSARRNLVRTWSEKVIFTQKSRPYFLKISSISMNLWKSCNVKIKLNKRRTVFDTRLLHALNSRPVLFQNKTK